MTAWAQGNVKFSKRRTSAVIRWACAKKVVADVASDLDILEIKSLFFNLNIFDSDIQSEYFGLILRNRVFSKTTALNIMETLSQKVFIA